jgi:uroporphyrin-III C-methyltransferase
MSLYPAGVHSSTDAALRAKANAWCGSRAAIPCIFGRGGEEAQWLRERGVEVELVNGITAGLARHKCAIPLTLRGVARRDAGHCPYPGRQSSELAGAGAKRNNPGDLHGVAKLGEIREQLLAGGMATDTPVAMIENASLPTSANAGVT